MCKRYSFTVSKEVVGNQFDIEIKGNLKTSYNIAPTQHAYVITNVNKYELEYITWGLIPYWSKEGANTGKLINARKEGIAVSTSFRIPIRRRRCLVLADSYYVWKKQGLKESPYRIVQDNNNLMVMAGIWDLWGDEEQEQKSFSIITIPSPDNIDHINSRCPLVLETTELQHKWIQDADLDSVLKMMGTKPKQLQCYPISKKVNSIKFNSIELHEELAS